MNLPRLGGEGWFFNPLAWQLLLVCGLLIGQAVRGQPGGPRLPPRSPWLTALAAAVVVSGFAWQVAWRAAPGWDARVPEALAALVVHVDKTSLHPARLASILALAYLVGHFVPRSWRALGGPWMRPFLRMGQHGLSVFCAGILVSFLGRLLLEAQDGWAAQVLVNLLCFALLVAVAEVAARYKRLEREGRSPALPRRAEAR